MLSNINPKNEKSKLVALNSSSDQIQNTNKYYETKMIIAAVHGESPTLHEFLRKRPSESLLDEVNLGEIRQPEYIGGCLS